MDQAWVDAARAYNSMDERGRHAYWNQLTPEQQAALTEALAAVAPVAQPRTPTAAGPEAPRRRGLFGTFAIGCTGVILGVILTIAFEIAAIARGIDVFSDLVSSGSPPSQEDTRPVPDETPDRETPREDDRLDCRNPRNAAERNECSRQRYQERREDWKSRHPGEEYPCEAPSGE